jgi:copper chaperone CopZ
MESRTRALSDAPVHHAQGLYTGKMRVVALALIISSFALRAEFLRVHLEISQMDCATCITSLEIGFRKMKGVEKVSVSSGKGAEFDLQPGNRITLERLRDTVKGIGFTPTDANVSVKGKVITGDGQWRFEVTGIQKTYSLSAPNDAMIEKLKAADGRVITLTGISPAPPDPRTIPSIKVTSFVETP